MSMEVWTQFCAARRTAAGSRQGRRPRRAVARGLASGCGRWPGTGGSGWVWLLSWGRAWHVVPAEIGALAEDGRLVSMAGRRPFSSTAQGAAFHLALDGLLGEARPAVGVPRVHRHAESPRSDDERGPEEPGARGTPDHHKERVDQQVGEEVTAKVTPFLQLVDRLVAGCLLGRRVIVRHDGL